LFSGEESLEPGSQRQYSLVDFELIRVIGRGSYAKVLMVELKKTHRIYAMKVIKKALVTDDEVSELRELCGFHLHNVSSDFSGHGWRPFT
jgi:serine/threonine protein kinase